jgi:hypothetical protein
MQSGVHGHLEGELPWGSCDEPLRPAMAKIVGKKYIFSNTYFFIRTF